MGKSRIRKNMISIRDRYPIDQRAKYDIAIYQNIINSDMYKNNNRFFIYISFRSEVDTKILILKMLKDKKEVYVPKIDINSNYMEAVRISSLNDLKENQFGTLEPIEYSNISNPNEIDVLIAPAIAFDIYGNRIGYGKGYYDTYIKRVTHNMLKVGLVYDFQIVDDVNANEYDENMDIIITEKRILRINSFI